MCEFHADNKLALLVFSALRTQWRVIAGMGGVSYQGLEYASVPMVMDEFHVPPRRRAALHRDLRVMERAALPVLNGRSDDG